MIYWVQREGGREGEKEGRRGRGEKKDNRIPSTYSTHYEGEGGADRSIIGCRRSLIFLPVRPDFCSVLLGLLVMDLISC